MRPYQLALAASALFASLGGDAAHAQLLGLGTAMEDATGAIGCDLNSIASGSAPGSCKPGGETPSAKCQALKLTLEGLDRDRCREAQTARLSAEQYDDAQAELARCEARGCVPNMPERSDCLPGCDPAWLHELAFGLPAMAEAAAEDRSAVDRLRRRLESEAQGYGAECNASYVLQNC